MQSTSPFSGPGGVEETADEEAESSGITLNISGS
jgi:hypothetical protein